MLTQKKEPRTLEEINKDYTALCAQLGQFHFQSQLLEEQKKELLPRIHELGIEGDKSRKHYEAKNMGNGEKVDEIQS